MPQQWPAADIARMILDGFDDYREHFRQITDGARARFEQAQVAGGADPRRRRGSICMKKRSAKPWRDCAPRFDADTLMDVSCWPLVKSAYISADRPALRR